MSKLLPITIEEWAECAREGHSEAERFRIAISQTLAILKAGADGPTERIVYLDEREDEERGGAIDAADFAVARLEMALEGK